MKKQMVRIWAAVVLAVVFALPVRALPRMLVPGGQTIGVKLYARGLLVTGFEESSAARDAGMKQGDVILRVDGEEIHTTAALRQCLEEEQICVTVLRNGKETEFCVRPREQQIGAYVQDSVAGIGTVTYYDPDTGAFGALGHGVGNANSKLLMPVEAGVAVKSHVVDVKKGKSGVPGELKGKFDVEQILGEIQKNDEHGVFGILTVPIGGKPMPVGSSDAVETGPAEIWSNVSGDTVQSYSVEILKIYPHAEKTGRNLLLQVTDPALLTATGGIVQGMSGSPIVQNGKLVGAVTHVLVNDPTRGYGIFIENMLTAAS